MQVVWVRVDTQTILTIHNSFNLVRQFLYLLDYAGGVHGSVGHPDHPHHPQLVQSRDTVPLISIEYAGGVGEGGRIPRPSSPSTTAFNLVRQSL